MCGATTLSLTRPKDGKRLKWLPICDEFSRELVALEVERRMEAGDVIGILDAAVAERGTAPEFIRSDNGPEFVALAVQDWIARRGFKTLYIKPAAHGRTLTAKAFTAGSETSSSTGKPSPRCWRQKCSASNIGSGTTKSARTRHWTTRRRWRSRSAALRLPPLRSGSRQAAPSPPTNSPLTHNPKSTQNSHSKWIKNRGQATRW